MDPNNDGQNNGGSANGNGDFQQSGEPLDGAGRDLADVFGEGEGEGQGEDGQGGEGEGQGGEGEGEGEGQGQGQQQQTQLTPDQIADKVAARWAATQQQHQQQQRQPEKQYTPEELDKLFNVWKPSPTLLKALREGDEEAALKEIIGMRDGITKQQVTMFNMVLDARLKELDTKYADYGREVDAIRGQREEKKFFTTHPDLSKYTKTVRMVFAQHLASGVRYSTPEQASKAVADEARALLKEMGVSTVAPNGNGQPQRSKMQTLSRGGNGGSGRSGQSAPTGIAASLRELA